MGVISQFHIVMSKISVGKDSEKNLEELVRKSPWSGYSVRLECGIVDMWKKAYDALGVS